MVNFKCLKCNKEFDKKFNYESHLNKKKPCGIIKEPPIIPQSYYKITPFLII